ncbi:MAG: hypothetical protein HY280_07655 [Nitrospinae bacterium]|nr:hypothetical protein [Nitrospinota bacterium]
MEGDIVFFGLLGLLGLVVVVRLIRGEPALGVHDGKPAFSPMKETHFGDGSDPVSASFDAGTLEHTNPVYSHLPGNIYYGEK